MSGVTPRQRKSTIGKDDSLAYQNGGVIGSSTRRYHRFEAMKIVVHHCTTGAVLVQCTGKRLQRLALWRLWQKRRSIGMLLQSEASQNELHRHEFLYFLLLRIVRRHPGTSRRSRYQSTQLRMLNFLRLRIPLPPLAEQQAIAHVLRTVQRGERSDGEGHRRRPATQAEPHAALFTYGPVAFDQADKVVVKGNRDRADAGAMAGVASLAKCDHNKMAR